MNRAFSDRLFGSTRRICTSGENPVAAVRSPQGRPGEGAVRAPERAHFKVRERGAQAATHAWTPMRRLLPVEGVCFAADCCDPEPLEAPIPRPATDGPRAQV